MSDPAYEADYQCHGLMMPVILCELTDCESDQSTAAYYCTTCGIWRHAYRRSDETRRALVDLNMPHFLKDLAR